MYGNAPLISWANFRQMYGSDRCYPMFSLKLSLSEGKWIYWVLSIYFTFTKGVHAKGLWRKLGYLGKFLPKNSYVSRKEFLLDIGRKLLEGPVSS